MTNYFSNASEIWITMKQQTTSPAALENWSLQTMAWLFCWQAVRDVVVLKGAGVPVTFSSNSAQIMSTLEAEVWSCSLMNINGVMFTHDRSVTLQLHTIGPTVSHGNLAWHSGVMTVGCLKPLLTYTKAICVHEYFQTYEKLCESIYGYTSPGLLSFPGFCSIQSLYVANVEAMPYATWQLLCSVIFL